MKAGDSDVIKPVNPITEKFGADRRLLCHGYIRSTGANDDYSTMATALRLLAEQQTDAGGRPIVKFRQLAFHCAGFDRVEPRYHQVKPRRIYPLADFYELVDGFSSAENNLGNAAAQVAMGINPREIG